MKHQIFIIGFLASWILHLPGLAATNSPSRLIAELSIPAYKGIHPSRRDSALRELLALNGQPDPRAIVNHVILCPQPDGSTLYGVFFEKDSPREQNRDDRFGKPIGLCHGFDSNGTHSVLCAVSKRDVFRDINGDGVVDHVEERNICFGKEISPCVTSLFIAPVLKDVDYYKTPSFPLIVAFNYEYEPLPWFWTVRDINGTGHMEILFGPRDSTSGQLLPEVTYTWCETNRTWQGPDGGFDQHYMRVFPTNLYKDMGGFTRAREKFYKEKYEAEQSVPGYPPQGVGSPEP